MVEILDESMENLLAVRLHGDIQKEDFEVINPVLEKQWLSIMIFMFMWRCWILRKSVPGHLGRSQEFQISQQI